MSAKRIEDGATGTVGIRELHLETSKLVKSVADGTRLVVTNHGSPRAMIFSMRDAVEMALDPEFAMLQQQALDDLEAGMETEPWSNTGPYEIAVAVQASEDLDDLKVPGVRHLRQTIRRELVRAARRPTVRSPIWIEQTLTGRWVVPFSRHGSRLVLVHSVIDACPVEDELIGRSVVSDRKRRNWVRLWHARNLEPRRLSRAPARRRAT